MRVHLPWKDRGHKERGAVQPQETRDTTAAEAAVRRAEQQYEQAKSQEGEVRKVVKQLRERQQVNHFREAVVRSLQEGYGARDQGRQHG